MLVDRVLTDDPELGERIARRAGTTYNPKSDHNFAHVKELLTDAGDHLVRTEQVLLGGVCYNHFTHESVQIHSAAWHWHWSNRLMIYLAFDYPFNQLRVKRLFGMVPESNWHAQVFNMKLGFKPVARIEGVFRHGDACVVMRMDREDCKYLGIKVPGITIN
jgi:hypothetical protein